ncbi:MAG TPA: prepilin-type N-terminal cleavage/methylation domain-containing protein [Candidatus Paceibacterota bacterium]|nr:MAG: hypothetical protein A3B44_02155 [Candidatus Levybacteria bacterium RIFCSPLOWO2_01_FULL_38_21]
MIIKQFKIQNYSAGFTLIELIVVLAVAAVISLVGIAAFVLYSQSQSLNATAADIANMFNVAKSRAASGVKPSSCVSQTLSGYKISLVTSGDTYGLYAVCSSGDYGILAGKLRSNIAFDPTSSETFFFPVLTGGFTGEGTIVLNGFGQTKTITVDSLGNVR